MIPAPPTTTALPTGNGQFPSFRLSDGQKSLWFAEQMRGASDAYNRAIFFNVSGELTSEHLRESLLAVCDRHPILRTRFVERNSEPLQILQCDPILDFAASDRILGDRSEARRRLELEASRPFDLGKDGPFRARLARFGSNDMIVLLVFHQIAADFFSLQIVAKELWELCSRKEDGSNLGNSLGFFAFLPLETRAVGSSLDDGVAFWTKRLDPLPVRSDLPIRPKGPNEKSRLQRVTFDFPPTVVESLSEFCRVNRATLFVGLVASLNVLLRAYGSCEQVTIGTLVSRRPGAFSRSVGHFINPVILDTRLAAEDSFEEILQKTKATVHKAMKHAHVPFGLLVERLKPERAKGSTPFFSILLNYLNLGTSEEWFVNEFPSEIGALVVTPEERLQTTPDFPLNIHVYRRGSHLKGRIDFDSGLYSTATIDRAVANWLHLLAEFVSCPEAQPTRTCCLSDMERQAIESLSSGQRTVEPTIDLFSTFEAVRKTHSQRIAICSRTERLTFDVFSRRLDRVAAALAARGIGRRDVVAIVIKRSPELFIAVWATLKTGAAFLAISPETAGERVSHMIREAKPVIVIGDRQLGKSPFDAVLLESLEANSTAAAVEWQFCPDDPAYIIFTSGSTGHPKGVVISRAGISNLLRWMSRDLGYKESDVFAQRCEVSFDVSVWELLLPPLIGARSVVVELEEVLDPIRLHNRIVQDNISVIHLVPSLLRRFIKACRSLPAPNSLKAILCGGERLDTQLARDCISYFSGKLNLWNMYGPAEASIDVARHPVGLEELTIPIGRPVPNTQLYIVNDAMCLKPVGSSGELLIGGVQVAKEYLANADLSFQRFVAAPWIAKGNLYRSGDLARWLPSGELEYLGRGDDQIKIRGIRIELGEVERAILEIKQVRGATVCVQLNGHQDPSLIAYVQLDSAITATEMRNQLRKTLVDAMLPSQFFSIEAFPLNPNGKIDKSLLPSLGTSPINERVDTQDSGDLVQAQVSSIFAEVLGTANLDREQHFFSLGGHSLQLVQVTQLVKNRIGVELTLADVMNNPSILGLCGLIAERMPSTEHPISGAEVGTIA